MSGYTSVLVKTDPLDPIEQYTATQPISQVDPIEQFGEPSSNDAAASTAGPDCQDVGWHLEEGCSAKQHRCYDDDTSQRALEVMAFRSASESMDWIMLRAQFRMATDEDFEAHGAVGPGRR